MVAWLIVFGVYLLFLDESGAPDEGVFAVGGIAVRADRWPELRSRWDSCLAESGWPVDKEVKWSGTLSGEVPPGVADAVYDCLVELPIQCFATVLWPDVGKGNYEQFFASEDDTYATALMFIAERYQRFLAQEDSYGVIVLDSRRREVDDRMRKFFTRIQRDGTPFAELERIVDGLLLGPSHFSLGLQLADLVVGPARSAQIKIGDGSRRHRQLLETVYCRHPASGEVDGVGIKFFPDSTKPNPAPDVRLFNPRSL